MYSKCMPLKPSNYLFQQPTSYIHCLYANVSLNSVHIFFRWQDRERYGHDRDGGRSSEYIAITLFVLAPYVGAVLQLINILFGYIFT